MRPPTDTMDNRHAKTLRGGETSPSKSMTHVLAFFLSEVIDFQAGESAVRNTLLSDKRGVLMARVIDNYHDLVRTDVYPALPPIVGRVLDLGGGVGATSSALKDAERASFVAVADQVADSAYGTVDQAFEGDLENESFLRGVMKTAGPFDTILALDILEHLRDPWNVVSWLQEGLAPKGIIVASIPNVNYRGLVFPLLFRGRYEYTDAGLLDRTHIRWFARHGAIELMSPHGMEIEVVIATLRGRKDKILNKLTLGLLNRFLARQYIIRARRVN